MRSMNKIWIGIGVLVAALASVPVAAQVAQDFPNLKGPSLPIGGPFTASRTGRNGDPAGSSPGPGNLRWFTPNGVNFRVSGHVIDNTDVNPVDLAQDGFPYPVNPGGYSVFDPTQWASPTLAQEALDGYEPQVRPRPDLVNGYPRNSSPRIPAYRYVRATAAASHAQPTVAANPASLQTFTWRFSEGMAPGRYALNIYLPAQPTVGITPAPNDNDPEGRVFSQRYYVYRITYGNNQSRTEIIDAYTNNGWVRLGNGGSSTNSVFDFDGIHPVTVTLYNTVPRDTKERVMLPDGATNRQGPNNFLVYADACQAIPAPGYYAATPTSARLVDADVNSTVVTAASNVQDVAVNDDTGESSSFSNAIVTNYNYQNGDVRWTYTPIAESSSTLLVDDFQATLLGAWVQDATVPRTSGNSASLSLVSATAVPTASATYNFAVPKDGSYAVYAYIPPDIPATYPMAQGAQYEIETFTQSAGTQITTVTVDQSAGTGWVRLGSRFFHSINVADDADVPVPFRVRLLNSSALASDQGAKYVYTDAIRVIGEAGIGVTSSPVHATALIRKTRGGTPEETKVVFIADETGHIHCLDAAGNGDGTTREYWCYPSLRDTADYDPNTGPLSGNAATVYGEDWSGPGNTPAVDRTSTAIMPTSGFDLSTAIIQRVDVGTPGTPSYEDRLYIGAANGRVYAINVSGRGDCDGTADPESGGTRTVGTTTRAWTFPATYPAANPVETSALGTFRGSLSYFDTNGAADGGETIYAPASQGRMYALDAKGDATTKTTSLTWTFPALDQPTLGPIWDTPSVEFGNIYFGTNMKESDAANQAPGGIYALNAATGAPVWATPFYRSDITTTDVTLRRTDNFQAGLVTIPGTFLTNGVDTICALNENRVFYWINAATGALIFATDELQGGAVGSLGFAMMNPFDTTGAITAASVPMVLVPLSDGRLRGIRANYTDTEAFGSHIGWGRDSVSGRFVASMANSNGWLYAADTAGYLRGYNFGSGLLVPGEAPDVEFITDNNPIANRFRKAKIKLITGDQFRALRRPEGDPQRGTYATATNPASEVNTDVVEWGQSLYLLVYDFPYEVEDGDGDPVDPPTVSFNFAFDGKNARTQSVVSRTFDYHVGANDEAPDTTVPRFEDVRPLGPMADVTDNPRMNGFAILPYPITSGGNNSLPPGRGEVQIQITTGSLNDNGALQTVGLPPNVWHPGIYTQDISWSRYPLTVANPLAVVAPPSTSTLPNFNTSTDFSLGLVADPGGSSAELRQEALENGSLDVPGTAKRENLIGTNTEMVGHGSTGKARVWIVDRSYMSLLRPGGVFGLDNVRLDRRDLTWQGGASAVIKPFDPAYTNFEDYPVNFPNTSLDYPDIRRERIKITKDPNGSAENPLFSGVALYAPRTLANGPLTDSTPPAQRVLRPTPFQIDVEVPKYQPANFLANLQTRVPGVVVGNSTATGALGQQGYITRMNVFVDTTTNGALDMTQREAYRSFNLGTGVGIDERLRTTTPIVDLGTLAAGTGYNPSETLPGLNFNPSNAFAGQQTYMNPWTGMYSGIFKNFGVVNEGNVNLLDVRVAKRSVINSAGALPLAINPDENDPLAWLNGAINLHTDIDWQYSPGPGTRRTVVIQKPRVTDRIPTELKANPVRRANSNLGTTGLREMAGNTPSVFPDVANESLQGSLGNQTLKFEPGAPKVGVSVPIGFPVGHYSSPVVIFENLEGNLAPFSTWGIRPNTSLLPSGIQPHTDPGFNLTFNVAETRLTNSFTPNTSTMIDDLASGGTTEQFRYLNTQPTAARDRFGNLITAFVSNRPDFGTTPAGTSFSRAPQQVFVSALTGSGGAAFSSATDSPLADLMMWRPAVSNRWWRKLAAIANNSGWAAGTLKNNYPTFPVSGFANPWSGAFQDTAPLVSVISGRRNPGSGEIEESKLALSMVSTTVNASVSVGPPLIGDSDAQLAKSEPSVVYGLTGNVPFVFYTGVSGGKSWSYYSRVNTNGFGPASALPFGSGFLNTRGLSATARPDKNAIEMTFSGQLRGRPNAEVFLARAGLRMDGDAPMIPLQLMENSDGTLEDEIFRDLPQRSNELLVAEAPGVYRARGVQWNTTSAISLFQIVGSTTTDLLVPNTRQVDRETGLISFESRLGGRVIFDPAQGMVRFSSSVPTAKAQVFATYTPRFLRLSDGAGGTAKTVQLYDQRIVSNLAYWRTGTGSTNGYARTPTNDRLIVFFDRLAAGGATSRPFMSSYRYGMNLPTKLPTLADGQPGYINDSGATMPAVPRVEYLSASGWVPVTGFEMDPAQGKIYLPSVYEGASIRAYHVTVDSDGIVYPMDPDNPTFGTASLVTERTAEPVRIETAVNESGICAFLEPLEAAGGSTRPNLLWLFWTSTRGGVPDIYFESIAPIWRPAAISK